MKKTILNLLCIVGLLNEASAQIAKNNLLLSATGNVSSSKSDYNSVSEKSSAVSYSLSSHYLLSNHLALGIWVNGSQFESLSNSQTNTFGISCRYFLNIGKRWNFYSGLGLGYHVGKFDKFYSITGTTEADIKGFVENVQVGLLFKLGKRWNIDVNSTLASFEQNTLTIKSGSESTKTSSAFRFAPDGLLSGTRVGICFVFGKMTEPSTDEPIKE